jgi:hypothetical protein
MRPKATDVDARRAEIARRYRWHRRNNPPHLAALRVRDLDQLFRARYGEEMPDDDAARDDIAVMVHHLAALPRDPRQRVRAWLHRRAPWLSPAEAGKLLDEAINRPRRWRADKLGKRLGLTTADRTALRITTIGAIDQSKAQRTTARRKRNRLAKEAKRRKHGAIPRDEYENRSIARVKPWLLLEMSRATWYRAGRPQPRETSPGTAYI